MAITTHTKKSLIAFEQKVREEWESGNLPSLVHLCGGDEDHLLDIFQNIRPNDWVFLSHRGHYAALLKGMAEDRLMEFIRSDRSMFIFDRDLRIYQSAILGGTLGIAVGVAQAIKERAEDTHCWVFMGDGAEDGGTLHPAAMFATGHSLPVTFVVANNNRQVDTTIQARRGPNWRECKLEAPCILRYDYEPTWPHGGSGCSHQITFKRTTPLP